jgi:hypothetical protein
MALSPLIGQRAHSPAMSRVLRRGTQPGASPCGVSRTDAGRDVFWRRGRGSSRPDGARGRRTPRPRRGEPIGGLRDVPINRGGRMITDSRSPRACASGGDCPRHAACLSRWAEPCSGSTPLEMNDENSRATIPNVPGDSSESRTLGSVGAKPNGLATRPSPCAASCYGMSLSLPEIARAQSRHPATSVSARHQARP